MEHIIDDFEFISADQLAERIQDWITSPDLISGSGGTPIVYLEDGQANTMKRAVLIQTTLTDGSKVYNVRVS